MPVPEHEDKTLECIECQEEFTFTARDQQFYATKTDAKTGQPWGPPKRCPACRAARKQNKRSQGN